MLVLATEARTSSAGPCMPPLCPVPWWFMFPWDTSFPFSQYSWEQAAGSEGRSMTVEIPDCFLKGTFACFLEIELRHTVGKHSSTELEPHL